jgi:cytochrome c
LGSLLSTLGAATMNGVFSKAQTEHGAAVYRERCAACHGDQLDGGDHGPSLRDDTFWQEWDGKSARSLYSRIISTMPPDDAGSVPPKDVIDIVAHIIAASGAAPGQKSVVQADELNPIQLERPR